MTKTAKQILTSLDKGEYLGGGGVDQALKEIEAIHQQEIARARVDELQRVYVDHDDRKLRHIDGTKLTTIEHRIAELSQTLKELEAEL